MALRCLLASIILFTFCNPSTAQDIPETSKDGPYYRIGRIHIAGNNQTHDYVITRELTFATGQELSRDELDFAKKESVQNLINTLIFRNAEIQELPVDSRNMELLVVVEEGWYWWPTIILKHGDTNFNTWWETKDLKRLNVGGALHRQNLTGNNDDLTLLAQLGYSKQFGASYYLPFITRQQRLGAGIGGFFGQRDEIVYGTADNRRLFISTGTGRTRESWAARLFFTYRKRFRDQHRLELAYRGGRVLDSVASVSEDYLHNGRLHMNYLQLHYSFRLDFRDYRPYPLEGSFMDLHTIFNGLGITGDGMHHAWAFIDLRKYFALSKRWFAGMSLRSRIGLSEQHPYYLQEGLGYNNFVRGYEYYVMDGQHFALFKSTVKFKFLDHRIRSIKPLSYIKFNRPIIRMFLTANLDAGYTWDNRYFAANPLSNEPLIGGGLGLDITSIYEFVVRFEVSWNHLGEHGYFLHFTQPL